MPAAETKAGRKGDGKTGKGTSKRLGVRRQDGKKGSSKAGDDGLDFGPPLQRRGLFAARSDVCPLRNLMYGHGDVRPESINSSTVDLVEDIVIDYCTNLLQKAVDQAVLRSQKMQPEDVLFLLRKDPKKFTRGKELLVMNEDIKQARKQFDDEVPS